MQEETNFVDYYAVLGITPQDANNEELLKKAYKRSALKTHPDRNRGKEKEAQAQFLLVSKAFQVLNDPEQRRAYDAANPTAGKFTPAVPPKGAKAQQSSEPVLSLMYKPVVTQTWGDYDVLRKFVFFGEAGGPKTKIFDAQTEPLFGNKPTMGIDFMLKTLERNGQRIKLQLWDLAGQERFRNVMQKIYTRGATGAMVIVNASDMKSIEDAQWRISEMRKALGDTAVIAVVASWDNQYKAVEEDELKAYCREKGAECFTLVNITSPSDIRQKCETLFEEMCGLVEAKEYADVFETTVDKAKEMIAQQRAQRAVVAQGGNNNNVANSNNSEEGLGSRFLRAVGFKK